MSLTMQMTPGADNLAVWVLRIKSEGTNQISNGTFDSGSNWTANDDWKIQNGAAEYTFVAVSDGVLDQTLSSSVDSVPYILEYEITSLTSGTFTFTLIGAGASIVAASVTLPITLGQHRIIIQGVSGKSLFRIKAGGFSSLEAMFIDNIKLRKLEETAYIATETLTLDNTYDGETLEFNDRLSDINEFMDIQGSGSISGVSSFTFTVPRYVATSGSRFDGWFSEFYPTYDGSTLISRECEVGVVWNTASNDTEITWLMRGKIVDYRFEPRKMIITVLQSTEIDSRPLPYYQVQKDFDNEVSYFTNAPDENYGVTLPIVYGDFTISIDKDLPDGSDPLFHRLLAPVVNVDKHKLKYIVATHEMNADNFSSGGESVSYKYLDGINAYMLMTCANGSSTNDVIKAFVQNFDTLNSTGNIILGTINVVPTLPGSNNDASDYDALINVKVNNEDELTITSTNEVALVVDGSLGSDVGALGTAVTSIIILVSQSDSVAADASDDTIITYFNPAFNKSVGGYGDLTEFGWNTGDGDKTHQRDITLDTTARDVTDESWTIEQVLNFEFVIRSKSGYTNKYKIMWLRLGNIVVTDARKTVLVSPGQKK